MTDTEYLTWVAKHVVGFNFGLHFGYLTYINDDGYEKNISVEFEQSDEDIDIFKRLIDKAMEDEKNHAI